MIAGAGPAGVSAALWARSRGLFARLLDRAARPGGQLEAVHFHPRDLPGLESGLGADLAAAYERQLERERVDARFGCEIAALDASDHPDALPAVVTGAGERHRARAVLVATGVRRRTLDVPGERELAGRGVSTSATRDRDAFAGRPVIVVGGGDAAYENALLLAEADCEVTLLVRDYPIARAEFQSRVAAEARIRLRERSRVVAFVGVRALEAVRVDGPDGRLDLPAAGAVIKIGVRPNTEWCRGVLACDEDGYLRVDALGRTSHPCVWAAGDVTRPLLPSITVAHGSAATAIGAIERALRARR